MRSPRHAVVRVPSSRIAEGEVTFLQRSPLDLDRARAQHRAYLDTLAGVGLELVFAEPADDHPDGVFVEDVLVVVDGLAVLTRPGAPSRRGEVESMVDVVERLGMPTVRIVEPATVDGGDVLVTDRHIFVGQSSRTNDAAFTQWESVAQQTGRSAVALRVDGCLHLKSAVTLLPDGSLIAFTDWVDAASLQALGYLVRSAAEPSGGDVLCVGNVVMLPHDAPDTAAAIRSWGFDALTIDVSELQKIEAGVTCMSVLF